MIENLRYAMKTLVALIMLFSVLVSGCAEKQTAEENLSILQPRVTADAVPENAMDVVVLAKENLTTMLHIQKTDIKVVEVIDVEWTNTSLGYPDPGKTYAQMTVPGYVIFLHAGGKLYEYHSDYARIAPPSGPVDEMPEITPPSNMTSQSGTVEELAKRDLASKLKIPEANVQVVRVAPTEWRDASLGYPQPGKMYVQVITPGFVIVMTAEGRLYEYHSDYIRVVPPPELK